MNTKLFNIFNRKISKMEKSEKSILEDEHDFKLQPYRFILLDSEERIAMDSFLKNIKSNSIECKVENFYKNINLNDNSEHVVNDEYITLLQKDYMIAGRFGTFEKDNKTYYSYIFDNSFFNNVRGFIQ